MPLGSLLLMSAIYYNKSAVYVILLILAEAQSCSLTSDHGPLLIITGDTKVSEETICADVYIEAHISSGRRAVFQACDLQYLYLVYIKNRIIIPDHCLYMAPLVQSNGVHAILVILYPKISQIGKCISGKRKILAAMDLSYRIAAGRSFFFQKFAVSLAEDHDSIAVNQHGFELVFLCNRFCIIQEIKSLPWQYAASDKKKQIPYVSFRFPPF